MSGNRKEFLLVPTGAVMCFYGTESDLVDVQGCIVDDGDGHCEGCNERH